MRTLVSVLPVYSRLWNITSRAGLFRLLRWVRVLWPRVWKRGELASVTFKETTQAKYISVYSTPATPFETCSVIGVGIRWIRSVLCNVPGRPTIGSLRFDIQSEFEPPGKETLRCGL